MSYKKKLFDFSLFYFSVINYCQPEVFERQEIKQNISDVDKTNCTCHSDEFQCVSSKKCIKLRSKCDYEKDCADFSDEDETNCPYKKCTMTSHFVCKSDKKCIPFSFKCDKKNDCKDNSDEEGCDGKTD